MGQSFLVMPYHIHNDSPPISTTNIPMGTCSGFLLRMSLISGGSREHEVNIPATIPIHLGSIHSINMYNKKSQTIKV